jgi:hypothetical protein
VSLIRSVICIAEDRASFEPAIKLLIASLARHGSSTPIQLFFPPASDELEAWVTKHEDVRLLRAMPSNSSSFNIKPDIILSLLNRGYDEVIWIDSDIIVINDIRPIFGGMERETFVVTEEALSGRHYDYGGRRAELWGFSVGRKLPFAVNTGVIRVTNFHRPLLERWRDLLDCPKYREAHLANFAERPWHMFTDQDVLTAVLSSSEFSSVPLKILRRGRDIIQYYGPLGYTVLERASTFFGGGPKFVHSQGPKPWDYSWSDITSSSKDFLWVVYLDVSPYTLAALKYKEELSDAKWMEPHFGLSKLLRAIGLWYAPLVGLPLAMMWGVKNARWRIHRELFSGR